MGKRDKEQRNLEKFAQAEDHLLVIRLSAMGDVAMAVPVIQTLVATYPNLKITVLTRSFFSVLFKEIPNTQVYVADVYGLHKGITGLGRLAKELKDLEITAVADLHNVLRSNVLKSIFYLFGIPVKQLEKGRAEKKELTRQENKKFIALKSTHQRYADVFKELGYPINFRNHTFPRAKSLPAAVKQISGLKEGKYLGIAPFAQHQSKTYPQDLMEKVLQKLQQQKKLKIFLFGGGQEELVKLQAWEKQFKNTICVAGKITFEQELSLISNLDAMLSMDSGNAHLAAMYGIPVISLWGVTHPYAGFKAFAQPLENCLLPDLEKYPKIPTSVYGNKVPEGYKDVMRSISPEKVVEKITSILV